ncbi:MAG: hypothetical protein RH860_00230 [Cytophagales bacterium]
MKQKTYISFISSANKSLVLIFGMVFLFSSSGLAEQMCQDMMTKSPVTEHSNMPDCPTKQGDTEEPMDADNHCDSELLCNCSPDLISVKDNTIVVNKTEIQEPDLLVVELMEASENEIKYYTLSHPKLYSSPPLFLTNESFLI